MRVLVTGGAGYIGSHTVHALQAAGHEVVVLDRRDPRPGLFDDEVDAVKVDVRDGDTLDTLFAGRPIDGVIHLAAEKSVAESLVDPGPYFDVNVGGTAILLGAMSRAGVRRFVYSSSCAVYGSPAALPIDENAPVDPTNPYGESKVLAERMLPWFETAFGIRSLALRYFNAAGAASDSSNGEDWRGAVNLVPVAIEAALGRRPPIDIYGADHATPDGTAIRDYVHVVDLGEAHRLALERLAEGSPAGALNLGTGRGTSVREVLDAVGEAVGEPVPHRIVDPRPGEPDAIWADATRARHDLGWSAKLDLTEIVRSAVAWHRRWGREGPG
jgi:UDP-glucose 4-epimerase